MRVLALALLVLVPARVGAQDPIVLEDAVPAEAPPYFEVPFSVPEGVVEIEVRHDDLSEANILDWGLRDPTTFRGWGGGNTEPIVIGVDAASRSYVPGPIPAGEWAVLVGQARIREPPARYRIEIILRTSATLAPQPERAPYAPVAALRTGPAWYAGDFHVHSRESGDAVPTLDDIADFAATRGLDFVELSEHNVVTQLDFVLDAQARHPNVLFLPGIEITTYEGHANAIGATEWIDFRFGSGLDASPTAMVAALRAQGALLSINHPVLDLGDACIGCAWALDVNASDVDAVELQNGTYSVTGLLFFERSLRFWERLLGEGAHVAAIGGSDDHRAGHELDRLQSPVGGPTTMVWAEELSAAAIVEAVRAGRTVVKLEGPGDPMLELFAGDARIGDTVTDRRTELRARVTGGAGARLRFVRNGRAVETIEVDADPFEVTRTIDAPAGDVDDRWRAELEVGGAPRVVTSYLWVRATGEPLDAGTPDAGMGGGTSGCGCRAAGRGASPTIVLASLALALRRRRRTGADRATSGSR